jgi:replicative DNA helicase
MELQKISETILETAKANNIPIILGAQLGRGTGKKEVLRLDNLREAGDIENDAKLVLGIWNQAKEDADSKDESLKSRKVDLEIVILKNRNGPSNQSAFLEFDRALSTIGEKSKQQYSKTSRGLD